MELIFVVAVGVVMGSDEEDATVLGVVCGVVIIVGDEIGTLGKQYFKGIYNNTDYISIILCYIILAHRYN